MESIIQFPNKPGELLRGVFHFPESHNSASPKHLVIFPNGGVMGAEGDYRAHLSIARHLTRGGFYVLRFSPSGFGISDGSIPDCPQKNLFNQIENGLIVDDIKAAVRYAKTAVKFSSITLSGICGGAISSFLATAEINEVEYVIPIGIPVVLDSDDFDYTNRMAALDKHFVLGMYLNKIFSLKAWRRLLFKRSNMTKIRASIVALFKKKGSYLGKNNEKGKFIRNPLFSQALKNILRNKKKILFVFGDTDGFWWEFQNLLLKPDYRKDQDLPFDIYLSLRADHMLALPEMQLDVAQAMMSWMIKHHKN
jgi:hypothetical protein